MSFQGKAVLVFLEEDNITKAYFRIKPLLTAEGPVTAQELAALPDEGFLRIVPDRNEQHTFKERMRTMCGYCMLDLRNQPAEANKIRTNKNYSPAHGENNQFIVYSDAVCRIDPQLFYQVVAPGEVDKAVTPFVYIREGANMRGPVSKESPEQMENVKQLPPDSQGIHSISANGQDFLFYWPKEKPVAESNVAETTDAQPEPPVETTPDSPAPLQTALDQIQELNKTCISRTANKLTEEKPAAPIYVPQQAPLNGTKLYSPAPRGNNLRRAHNPLMETVEMQRYTSKPEAPGAIVNDCAALKKIENPVDSFKRILQRVCINADDCRQAVEIFLSCPGMSQAVTEAISADKKDLTVVAMQNQLQEMEAERLMLLMQLDDVRKDKASLRNEALEEIAASEKNTLETLACAKAALEKEIEKQTNALLSLNEQRKEAEATLSAAHNNGNSVYLTKQLGAVLSKEALISRLENALKTSGFVCEKGDALAMLTAYAISRQGLYFSAANDADAALAAEVFSAVFGAPVSMNKFEKDVLLAPGGNTPAFIRSAPRYGCTTIVLPSDAPSNEQPIENPCAAFILRTDESVLPKPVCAAAPVSIASLDAFVSESKVSEEALAAIRALRHVTDKCALPLVCLRNAIAFIASTQNTFQGGVAEAIDRAVSMFILPYYLHFGVRKELLLNCIASMPRSMCLLNEEK